MRRIRKTLHLHLQAGLSYDESARAVEIFKSEIGKYVSRARVAVAHAAPQRIARGAPRAQPTPR